MLAVKHILICDSKPFILASANTTFIFKLIYIPKSQHTEARMQIEMYDKSKIESITQNTDCVHSLLLNKQARQSLPLLLHFLRDVLILFGCRLFTFNQKNRKKDRQCCVCTVAASESEGFPPG